jgi:plasmid stability protein
MRNLDVQPTGAVLIDDLDRIRDIRGTRGAEDEIRSALRALLESGAQE